MEEPFNMVAGHHGEVAEWLIAVLLKSIERDERSVGSNPALSAKFWRCVIIGSRALLKSVGRSEAGLGVRVPPPPPNIRIKCSYLCYDPSSTLGNQFTGLGMAYRSPSVYISRILYKLYL